MSQRRPRGPFAHPGAEAPPTAGLPATAAAAAPGLSDANRRSLAGRCRAAGSGRAPRAVAAMMPALAAQRRGCRGLYRLYLRCQAAPLPRACHGESLGARPAALRRRAAGNPPASAGRAGGPRWSLVESCNEGVVELRARVGESECQRSQAAAGSRPRAPAGAGRDSSGGRGAAPGCGASPGRGLPSEYRPEKAGERSSRSAPR